MANLPDGVEVLFENLSTNDATSDAATSEEDSRQRDFHQEAYESYVPPHKRGHNLQQDKFVNFKKGNDEDKQEGVDHDKYQRLVLNVPFALPKQKLLALKPEFPGVFFHASDNNNHDHPYSHVVTMIGTRLMQRKIRPGSNVLDVYGNPNACDRFNKSQVMAAEPKNMKALVMRTGPTDFIREVNKWGPYFDEEIGAERYIRGSLMSAVRSKEIEQFNVLQLVHTLYYIPFQELAAALHAPVSAGGKRVAYALVHRHAQDKGELNDGEQTYTKKFVSGERLVRQVNKATNSSYVHPDLSEILFAERKVWLPSGEWYFVAPNGDRKRTGTNGIRQGLAWECHKVNEETWIVEMVPYTDDPDLGVVDYAQMWDDDEALSNDDYLATPSTSSTGSQPIDKMTSVVIPTNDGKFVELDIPCRALYDHLRMRCIARKRDNKLFEELIHTANHMVAPSALFGDKPGMRCPPDKIFDVAVAAFVADIHKEREIHGMLSGMRTVLNSHARSLKLGPKYKDLSFHDLMDALRHGVTLAKTANSIYNQGDRVGAGLMHLDNWLN